MREHPKRVGERSETHVLAALVEAGYLVWMPWGEHHRADFIIESADGTMQKVQAKTGRLKRGAIEFRPCSSSYHHPSNQGTKPYMHDYRGQADLFGVYCPETGGVYLVPVDDVGVRGASLRVLPTKNAQSRRIRWASTYCITPPG